MKNKQQNLSYAIGIILFLFPIGIYLVASVFLILGLDINKGIVPIALTVEGVLMIYYLKRYLKINVQTIYTAALIALSLLLFSFFTASYFYDFSFDGQWYHQDAIILLKNGWNPYYDHLINNAQASGLNANYINHYPKAAWIVAASLYVFGGGIELAKASTLILFFSSCFLSYHFLKKWLGFSALSTLLIAGVTCASPVVIGQSLSFYVDGLMAACMLIFLLFLVDYCKEPRHFLRLIPLGLVLIFWVNLKFTALIYCVVFLFCGSLWMVYQIKLAAIKPIITIGVFVLLGVFLFGLPTYVQNTLTKGHPFYPLMGKNNEGKAIAEVQYPKNFFGKNRFEKLFLASFALPNYTAAETHPSIAKPLFTANVIKASIPYYRNHQPVVMSPLGPLEGELLILLIPLVLFSLISYRKSWFYFGAGALLFSCVIQPEFWNYRYAPQILFLIILLILPALMSKYKVIRLYTQFILILFLANLFVCHQQYYLWNSSKTNQLRETFNMLQHKKNIKIQAGWMKSFGVKLSEAGIKSSGNPDKKDSLLNFNGDDFSAWRYSIVYTFEK